MLWWTSVFKDDRTTRSLLTQHASSSTLRASVCDLACMAMDAWRVERRREGATGVVDSCTATASEPPHVDLGEQPAVKRRRTQHPPATKTSPFFPPPPPPLLRRGVNCTWIPPPSPYGLLQEALYADPWRVLVACILLNKTSCTCARRVARELFLLAPNAHTCLSLSEERLTEVISPLGLRKRASYIKRLSEAFVRDEWQSVRELAGCGKYAEDAYALFVSGQWRDVQPQDKELRRYHEWLLETGGLGKGLTREAPPEE